MDTSSGTQILGALGSLAGMLSVYYGFRNRRREIRAEEARAILAAGEKGAAAAASVQTGQKLDMVIGKGLLDSARENVVRQEHRFQGSIIDIRYTPAQKDQEARIARAEICSTLQLIKDHNNGVLPDEELDRMWTSYRCNTDAESEC